MARSAPGFAGQAFGFDGVDDFLNLGDPPTWKFGTAEDYSWVAWFRIDRLPIAVNCPSGAINSSGLILEKHHFNGAVTLFGTVRCDGIVGAVVRDGNINSIGLLSTTVVSPGAWYHVAVTADRNGLFSLYINGNLETAANMAGIADISNGAELTVGGPRRQNVPGTHGPFNGVIDEVAIFNRVLSASEIQAIFAAGSAGICKPAGECEQALATPTFNSPITITTGPAPRMGLLRDLNADGHLDIAIPDFSDRLLRVFLGNGHAQFTQASLSTIGDGGTTVDAADFDLDGKLDLVVSHQYTWSLFLYEGDGTGQFSFMKTLSQPSHCLRVRAADLNGDGKPDIALSLNGRFSFYVYLSNGDFNFNTPTVYGIGARYPHDLVVTDLNHDNKLDVVTIAAGSAAISVRLGNGDGTFQTPTLTSVGFQWPVGLALADFNADGHADVAVSRVDSASANRFTVAFGNGTGAFPTQTTFSAPMTAWSIASGDWNNDGILDLILPGPYDRVVTLYLGQGEGCFSQALRLPAGSFPFWVGGADVNEDGFQDIVVSNFDGGNMMVYLQAGNNPPVVQCKNVTVPAGLDCTTAADVDDGSFDPNGDPITSNQSPPGPYPVGNTTVTLTVTDSHGASSICTATVTVEDREAPVAGCLPTTNPAGGTIPPAGNIPKSGQNPDGFYELVARDNCDSQPEIDIIDSASDFVAGPFKNGDKVKITQAPGVTPNSKPMAGVIVAHIQLKGDAQVFAVDAAGNTSTPCPCRVPPPPK